MIIKRDILAKIKPFLSSPEAIVITGMRRVGKTTVLKSIYDSLPGKNKLFLDLENPINQKYFEVDNYDTIIDSWQALGIDPKRQSYVFLDEIQLVKNIPSVLKYLGDHYQIKFFLSGSASFYLKNLFSESMAGRKHIFEMWPLNFGEFLRLKQAHLTVPTGAVGESLFSEFSRYYNEFVMYGGFPGVVAKDTAAEKKAALEEIFSSYFQLEVLQLSDFRKTKVVRDLLLLLMQRVGSKLDIQKLASELGVARSTVAEYIYFFEQTYFVHLVYPYSRNRDTEIRATPKFYVCDSGLARHFSTIDEGRLFEQNICCALRQRGEVQYYQRKNGREIDFIADKKKAYEVKLSPTGRDMERLNSLAKELGLDEAEIVSKKMVTRPGVTYGFLL